MEKVTPEVQVKQAKALSESPQSQENILNNDYIQWIDDVKTAAIMKLNDSTISKINIMISITYSPRQIVLMVNPII